ncbi:heme-thiolate peroxidase [Gymnopilus junonius]|uniref:Heme-thiolate peroxidase n=1 Tax=Gymnopilus junonius TaxID=109634 RepID=A0A9P5TL87_GYMJU|nr:heme-thiolate peroxidase [Gymnopilus junonius]
MFASLTVYALLALRICTVSAFPAYQSLAGLTRDQLDTVVPTLAYSPPQPLPGPLKDDSSILVYDAAHPYQPLRPGDQRGPCPALNTLASHGYLPRNGVATPVQIINAVQQGTFDFLTLPLIGFNLENSFARFLALSTFLVNGNPITNLMSIGGVTPLTGQNPPAPATVSGLNTHNNCEGDTSMTRADTYYGDNHSFNETRFQNFVRFSNEFGAGKYNYTVAAHLREFLVEESIANNPEFTLVSPRLFTAFGESVFPVNFFIDGRDKSGQLDLGVARSFFQNMTFPRNFYRRDGAVNNVGQDVVTNYYPFTPGYNANGVNSFVVDPTSATLSQPCLRYTNFVNNNIKLLYPNPTGLLLQSLKTNLQYLYEATVAAGDGCTQVFPYGQ